MRPERLYEGKLPTVSPLKLSLQQGTRPMMGAFKGTMRPARSTSRVTEQDSTLRTDCTPRAACPRARPVLLQLRGCRAPTSSKYTHQQHD